MTAALTAVLGVLVGAVVNRLASDLPARRPPQRPRCPYCGLRRPWHQWVALPSYIVGRSRCPACAAPIPIRYPLTELGLGFLFAYLYVRYGPTARFGFVAAYTATLALIAITDLERRLILNVVTLPAMILALIGSLFIPGVSWTSALIGGLVGYLTFLVLAIAGSALVGPGAMGGGDVKLAALIGLMTGFPMVVEAIVLAILVGAAVSLFLLATRLRSMRDHVPYGPFLVVGGWVTLLWGPAIAQWFFSI